MHGLAHHTHPNAYSDVSWHLLFLSNTLTRPFLSSVSFPLAHSSLFIIRSSRSLRRSSCFLPRAVFALSGIGIDGSYPASGPIISILITELINPSTASHLELVEKVPSPSSSVIASVSMSKVHIFLQHDPSIASDPHVEKIRAPCAHIPISVPWSHTETSHAVFSASQ